MRGGKRIAVGIAGGLAVPGIAATVTYSPTAALVIAIIFCVAGCAMLGWLAYQLAGD